MTIKLILTCWLPWFGLWIALLRSPLIPHLVEKFWSKEPTTTEDVEMLLLQYGRYNALQLYTCIWCQAFWTSVAAALTLAAADGSLLWAPVYALSYYPLTAFASWKLVKIASEQ